MMHRIALLYAVLLVGVASVCAQRAPISLGLQAGISYSGWNVALLGQYHHQDFSAYLGPSMSLNRGLPGKGPLGLSAGLNYHLPSRLDWLSSLVNVDYQLHFFSSPDVKAQQIQEFHLSYGLEFHVTPALTLVQQLGYGGWLQSTTTTEGRATNSGYSGLVRLKAGYHF